GRGRCLMAHVEDRWKREGRHGTGKRWRVRYLDPDGKERSRSFDRKADAERFKDTTAADVRRGTWMDPDAGKITLRKYAEGWLAGQTQHQASTRESVEQRLRVHVYPDLGAGLGLRQGEILGLAVEDVDFLRKVVHVRRQVRIVRARLVFALPKGGKERDIPLPGTVALALAAHLADHPAAPVTLPWEEP